MNILAFVSFVDRQLIGEMPNDIPSSILLSFRSVLNSRNCEGGWMMIELKPCPFCGGKDSGILTTSYDGYWFAVFCENCMAHTRKCRQEKDAIEAWNRRVK